MPVRNFSSVMSGDRRQGKGPNGGRAGLMQRGMVSRFVW